MDLPFKTWEHSIRLYSTKDIPFSKVVSNVLPGGIHEKLSGDSFLQAAVETKDAIIELALLLSVGMMGFLNGRGQVATLNNQNQGRQNYSNAQQPHSVKLWPSGNGGHV